jgi:acetyl esterase/lipase
MAKSNRHLNKGATALLPCLLCALVTTHAADSPALPPGVSAEQMQQIMATVPRVLPPQPLYAGEIPNVIAGPDEERATNWFGLDSAVAVSRPTWQAWLPAPERNTHTAVVVFPGGGYEMLSMQLEGRLIAAELQDHGIAAVVVKYRLPSDKTMRDKSIGPLQDAQQAVRVVRAHAQEWHIDPHRVGVMGFSAGGHLAATVSTHFERAYAPNPDQSNLRPDFSILIYPVVTMRTPSTHGGSRAALLGKSPTPQQVDLFSNELQVTDRTPPALLLAASDDNLVDVDNSIAYYEALRRHKVPAELVLLPHGDHGFFHIPRDEWLAPLWTWLRQGGWMMP